MTEFTPVMRLAKTREVELPAALFVAVSTTTLGGIGGSPGINA